MGASEEYLDGGFKGGWKRGETEVMINSITKSTIVDLLIPYF